MSRSMHTACPTLALLAAAAFGAEPAPKVGDALKREALRPRGSWQEATVPDTLDLAERAKLSVRVLTNSMDPTVSYGIWSIVFEPALKRVGYPTWDITPKHARTLPALRAMCG